MISVLPIALTLLSTVVFAQQVNHNIEHAGRIQCTNPNVFRTKNFYNCVSNVLGTGGIIASDDQFAACSSLQVNQAKYLECICTKTMAISECYNKHCPGDSGFLTESQNQARYCAAYSTAIYIPKTESYTLPPLPSLEADDSYGSYPSEATVTAAVLPTGPAINVPKLEFPSGEGSDKWGPVYFAMLFALGIFL